MDSRRVVDLRKEAKRLRIKRFSRLRKQELIDKIRTARNILDEEIPEIDSPILRPTKYVKTQEPPEERDRKKEIRELEEMLGLRPNRHISRPEMKITNPEEVERDLKIKRIKEIRDKADLNSGSLSRRVLCAISRDISGFGVRHWAVPENSCKWSGIKCSI